MPQSTFHFRLQKFSYRFAEQILNSNLAIKQEVEDILLSEAIDIPTLSRPQFNKVLRRAFVPRDGKTSQQYLMSLDNQVRRWIS